MSFNKTQPAYEALRSIVSERTRPIAVWVGAGPSRSAGLPSWAELIEELENAAKNKAATLEPADAVPLEQKIEAARRTDDNWLKVQHFQDALDKTSFEALVRRVLRKQPTSIPRFFDLVWKLPTRTVLTTNLDRLLEVGFQNQRTGRLSRFAGWHSSNQMHLLTSVDPLLVYLHGDIDDTSTWVLTKNQLTALRNNGSYVTMLETVLVSNVVIFMGVSADDVSIGAYLERLSGIGASSELYWITDRADLKTDRWAERNGVQVIRYTAHGGDHSQLEELVEDLCAHVSLDDEFLPVVARDPNLKKVDDFTVESLRALSAEEVRWALNSKGAEVLAEGGEETNAKYAEFLEEYAEAVHRAWFIRDVPPDNVMLGYSIEKHEKKGAFGKVYRATDRDGEQVAIKILGEEVREDSEYLQCFRRGVQSMKILTDREVSGMVAYRDATEIPACAIMDFVEGPNLEEAVESRLVHNWTDVLRISMGLSTVLKSAHGLPERVLHRDVRPSNVMLEGYYLDPSEYKVVVLDFDLSWHRGALGMSMENPNSSSGYVSPEQVGAGGSTRSALVDSFGIGMTLFYLVAGRHPIHQEHLHADWRKTLQQGVGAFSCPQWKSLPRRFARLIEWSTKADQTERWDMSQIVGELSRLNGAYLEPGAVSSAELLAEELAGRSSLYERYQWSREEHEASSELHAGLFVAIAGLESSLEVRVRFVLDHAGGADSKTLMKWMKKAFEQSEAKLRKAGWAVDGAYDGHGSGQCEAKIPCSELVKGLEESAHLIDQCSELFSIGH